ncbi:helix-turn-helix transcriptional regulator [bacterium SCSIO 12741]|nr:helix-turn-helix transcriptional regulator [bacterium SCSIO 12741]
MRANVNQDYHWFHTTFLFSTKLNRVIGLSNLVKEYESDFNANEKLVKDHDFLRNNYFKFVQLTSSQRVVLGFLAEGKSNKDIAELMNVSPHTIRTHRNNIHKALGLRWKSVHPMVVYIRFARVFGLGQIESVY